MITDFTEEAVSRTTLLADFFKYHLWANLRILDACANISDAQLDTHVPGTFGSARDTLMHIFAAEEGYDSIFTGQRLTQPLRESDPFPGFDELRRRAQLYGESLLVIVEEFNPEQVLHLPYEGQFYDVPAILVLIQAINHAADHRSQVATMLSQQGITLPELNSWAYYHEVIRPESGGLEHVEKPANVPRLILKRALHVAGDLFEARNGHRCKRADIFLSELALHLPVGDPVDAAARSLFLPSREASRSPKPAAGCPSIHAWGGMRRSLFGGGGG